MDWISSRTTAHVKAKQMLPMLLKTPHTLSTGAAGMPQVLPSPLLALMEPRISAINEYPMLMVAPMALTHHRASKSAVRHHDMSLCMVALG